MQTTNPVNIRKAVKGDCASILQLIRELAVYEKAPDAVVVSLDHFIESGFGEKPVWWAFVAETPSPAHNQPGAIIGFALYYIRYSTWNGQRMYLEDILVTNEHRGKGIGKLLFDQLIEEAKEKKLNGMAWQVLDWNEPAINFYKKYPGVNFESEWMNCTYRIEG
ncbi:GNAT family N-acetyltransferase [soil metagenome]